MVRKTEFFFFVLPLKRRIHLDYRYFFLFCMRILKKAATSLAFLLQIPFGDGIIAHIGASVCFMPVYCGLVTGKGNNLHTISYKEVGGNTGMIEVSSLTKTYGKKRGIDRISFSITEGEIVGFLGPNGAGKSTTMNIITGYLSANSGAARIAGIDILENPVEAKKHIGYLPEQPPLYLDMTVDEYLNFIYDLKADKSVPRLAHITEITEMVGL